MSDQPIDPAFQNHRDGELTERARARLLKVKVALGLSYTALGKGCGLSPAFMSNITRGAIYNGRPSAIRSKHIPRLRAWIEQLEERASPKAGRKGSNGPTIGSAVDVVGAPSLDDLIRAITDRGFAVTLAPLR